MQSKVQLPTDLCKFVAAHVCWGGGGFSHAKDNVRAQVCNSFCRGEFNAKFEENLKNNLDVGSVGFRRYNEHLQAILDEFDVAKEVGTVAKETWSAVVRLHLEEARHLVHTHVQVRLSVAVLMVCWLQLGIPLRQASVVFRQK